MEQVRSGRGEVSIIDSQVGWAASPAWGIPHLIGWKFHHHQLVPEFPFGIQLSLVQELDPWGGRWDLQSVCVGRQLGKKSTLKYFIWWGKGPVETTLTEVTILFENKNALFFSYPFPAYFLLLFIPPFLSPSFLSYKLYTVKGTNSKYICWGLTNVFSPIRNQGTRHRYTPKRLPPVHSWSMLSPPSAPR